MRKTINNSNLELQGVHENIKSDICKSMRLDKYGDTCEPLRNGPW